MDDNTEMLYRNFYKHCNEEWDNEWDSMCDDECPVCGAAISPYKSILVKKYYGSLL